MHDCLRYSVLSARSAALGEFAKRALIEEVELTPKPGLVDQHNTGSHSDLTISLMKRSALCLAPYFAQMAELGEQQGVSVSMREALGLLGRHAESAMMAETQGVNTHRGAIWALGLLSAAAASLPMRTDANAICQRAGRIALLADRHTPATFSQGKKAAHRYGIHGAKQQAQQSFPAITHYALPTLRHSRLQGQSENTSQLNALLSITANLSDTCVLARAGLDGLQHLQRCSQAILDQGGASTPQGYGQLCQLDQDMIAMNASPGGAADLLAATLFVDWIEQFNL